MITEAARASGLQQAMIVIPIVNVLLAFVLFMGSRTILADMLKRQKAAAVGRGVNISHRCTRIHAD